MDPLPDTEDAMEALPPASGPVARLSESVMMVLLQTGVSKTASACVAARDDATAWHALEASYRAGAQLIAEGSTISRLAVNIGYDGPSFNPILTRSTAQLLSRGRLLVKIHPSLVQDTSLPCFVDGSMFFQRFPSLDAKVNFIVKSLRRYSQMNFIAIKEGQLGLMLVAYYVADLQLRMTSQELSELCVTSIQSADVRELAFAIRYGGGASAKE